MSFVRTVAFPDQDGIVRDLRVTAPPGNLVLLPEPGAPKGEFVEAAKATKVFLLRLFSFRMFVGVLQRSAELYAGEGSMATAMSADGASELSVFAAVFVSSTGSANGTAEEDDGVMRFGYAHGRDLDGFQIHVRVGASRGSRVDPVPIAEAWLATLEPEQRFDLVSEAQPR